MTDHLIKKAVASLQAGGVIAYPTEAVWGLGCDPENESAVRELLRLKQRPVEKGLILVAASIDQFKPYLSQVSAKQYRQLQVSWPGFQTWVVPAPEFVPFWLKGEHPSIALRVSAHPLVKALCQAFGRPIVSTSANHTGQPVALDEQQVKDYFENELAFILPGELGGAANPSSIIDIVTGQPIR